MTVIRSPGQIIQVASNILHLFIYANTLGKVTSQRLGFPDRLLVIEIKLYKRNGHWHLSS